MERPDTNGTDWLDGIGVASPCTADWNQMKGDDRCRFCSQCSLNVFDLSAMTRKDAEELVASRSGNGKKDRLCVRFMRRADGTVLTRDCPVGLRQRLRRTASRLVAMCTAAFAFLGCRSDPNKPDNAGTGTPPTKVEPQPEMGEACIMGDVMIAPAPQQLMGRIRVETPDPEPVKKKQ